jgi:hypothetical protein
MKDKIINQCLNNIVDATFQIQGGQLGPRQLGAIADIRENVATIKNCIEDNCQPENNFLQCQINIMNKRLDCLTAKLQQLVEEK